MNIKYDQASIITNADLANFNKDLFIKSIKGFIKFAKSGEYVKIDEDGINYSFYIEKGYTFINFMNIKSDTDEDASISLFVNELGHITINYYSKELGDIIFTNGFENFFMHVENNDHIKMLEIACVAIMIINDYYNNHLQYIAM